MNMAAMAMAKIVRSASVFNASNSLWDFYDLTQSDNSMNELHLRLFSEHERERERELTFTFAICSSVCLSSVTFVRPTQAVQIFGNISTTLDNLASHW